MVSHVGEMQVEGERADTLAIAAAIESHDIGGLLRLLYLVSAVPQRLFQVHTRTHTHTISLSPSLFRACTAMYANTNPHPYSLPAACHPPSGHC